MPDPRDEFTLLCERCGYVIEGLPRDCPCPECGTPTAESLPERRPGSPWQSRPGFLSWSRTATLLLTHPRAVWPVVRIEPVRQGFGRVNAWAAALLISIITGARFARKAAYAPAAPPPSAHSFEGDDAWWVVWLEWFVVMLPISLLAIACLTQIEVWGVRFFGNRRGWRVTPTVADAVCGHASIGWLLGGILYGTASLAVDTGTVQRSLVDIGLAAPYTSAWIRGLLPANGLFIGLLTFEFLVYFGVRRNRFANRARSNR